MKMVLIYMDVFLFHSDRQKPNHLSYVPRNFYSFSFKKFRVVNQTTNS